MKRLMVVDDEAVITTQLEDHLRSMKYDVVGTAATAEESVSMARELCPDLILMDIVMKGKLDGIDAAGIIKEDMDIPIIFLTAYADEKYIRRATEVEPFGYIVKPFRENEVKANIEIALHKKDLERKHKEAEERLRRLFLAIDHNPYMIMIVDNKGNIEFINNKFSQITDFTSNEIVGKNIHFLQFDKISSEIYEMMAEISSGGEWRGELCVRKRDGTPGLKYTVALPVKNTNGDVVFAVVVSEKAVERKKRKEEFYKSRKLNAVRTITAGVAHEFNNILTVVHGSAELLEGGYRNRDELNKGLQNIMEASDKGAGIVRNMITIAKSDKNTAEYILFDLKQLIIQALDSTIPGWKNRTHPEKTKYEIERNAMKRIPGVFCNPAELRDVFINLINNALDAMPDGGRISFSTWNNQDKVFVKITDTGVGMLEELKEMIFDPFFTTRRPLRTGLGLSIVYSIMARHDGRIEVDSKFGQGTTITLGIPINSNKEN